MRYELKNGLGKDFVYAASNTVAYRTEFFQEADGVSNALPVPPEGWDNYQYVSAVLKEKVKLPVTLAIETSFDSFGAPLIIFSETLDQLADGKYQYGRHMEAVLYEAGINLWLLEPKPEGGRDVTALCKAKLPFPEKKWERLTVRLTREGIAARAGELEARSECALPEEMYVGFTACEGINHFRIFEVNEEN